MCGRTCCNCQPDIYRKACSYLNPKTEKYVIPEWKDVPGHDFKPSPNVAPTDFTPVILHSDFERILQPMMWGMIPPWHKVKVENKESWNTATWNEESGWTGPKLMKFAGLYNEWHSPENELLYSYTIITMEANETLNWLHHRMPAILANEDQLTGWLDIEGVNSKDAIDLLTPVESVNYHLVSDLVNNSRNKDGACNKPKIESRKPVASSSLMQNWLKGGTQKRPSESSPNEKEKKPKF